MASSFNGGVFTQLKHRARSSFVGKHRLDVILHSRLEDGPKYVSMSTLKAAFGVAGLVLTEEEAEYLVKRFADNRRRVEWRRLAVALDVAAPADLTDPDRSFLDKLPQPYRLIVSVLDTEIVDRAWALIVERHPELDTSVADEARAAAEIDLKRSCPPSVRLQNPHPPLLLGGACQSAVVASAVVNAEELDIDNNSEDAKGTESPSQLQQAGTENDSHANADADGNNTIDDGDGGGGGGGAGVSFLRWDPLGELLFTGGSDGSVCLRVAGALDDIAVQVSSIGVTVDASEGTEEKPAPSTVKFLSRPVGALRVRWGSPSSVRIAAVVTPKEEGRGVEKGNTQSEKEHDGHESGVAAGETFGDPTVMPLPTRSSSFISVLEAALPEPKVNTDDNNSATSGKSQRLRPSHTAGDSHTNNSHDKSGPTLRVFCVVTLPSSEWAVACALSPDGKRLAASLSSGRVATWVLPSFKPPSQGCVPSAQRNRQSTTRGTNEDDLGERAPIAIEKSGGGEHTAADQTDGASIGESSTSLAGDDDATAIAKAEAVAAAEAAANAPPVQLMHPEFSIPHLPSPEDVAYTKALHEYRKKVETGEIRVPTSSPDEGKREEEGTTPPPRPPQLSGCAHHLARVAFLPAVGVVDGGDGGHSSGGGLSVWRTNSNVWRFYRLPPPPADEADGATRGHEEEAANGNGGTAAEVSPTTTSGDASGEDSAKNGGGCDAVMAARFDISSLPSAEWVLPSPVTALAVSEEAPGERFWQSGHGVHDAAEGRVRCGRSSSWSAPTAKELLPLVAIGTENGGVYVCDAVLGTTREGLSRHRSRVTALAFQGKTFLVSGSADEMLQIHHVSIAAAVRDGGDGGGGGRCFTGAPPRLRCLHDARGSEIVRVACLRDAPLAFAEDTSRRIVAYDLLSGSMLGVLSLASDSVACANTGKKPGNQGGGGAAEGSLEVPVQKEDIVWASGGNHLAAIVPTEEEDTQSVLRSPNGGGESLGVWSAADVMWELSPGMRAIAGGMRPLSPNDVAGLFFDLGPAQRKDVESKTDLHQHHHPNLDSHSLPPGVAPPPATGTTNSSTNARRYRTSGGAGAGAPPVERGCRPSRPSGVSGGSGGGGGGRGRSAASKTASSTVDMMASEDRGGRTSRHSHHRGTTTLTEGNVARLLAGATGAAGDGKLRAAGFSWGEEGLGPGGVCVPWWSEVGAMGRVQQYMASRGGARAARHARLDNVTRNLLHIL